MPALHHTAGRLAQGAPGALPATQAPSASCLPATATLQPKGTARWHRRETSTCCCASGSAVVASWPRAPAAALGTPAARRCSAPLPGRLPGQAQPFRELAGSLIAWISHLARSRPAWLRVAPAAYACRPQGVGRPPSAAGRRVAWEPAAQAPVSEPRAPWAQTPRPGQGSPDCGSKLRCCACFAPAGQLFRRWGGLADSLVRRRPAGSTESLPGSRCSAPFRA